MGYRKALGSDGRLLRLLVHAAVKTRIGFLYIASSILYLEASECFSVPSTSHKRDTPLEDQTRSDGKTASEVMDIHGPLAPGSSFLSSVRVLHRYLILLHFVNGRNHSKWYRRLGAIFVWETFPAQYSFWWLRTSKHSSHLILFYWSLSSAPHSAKSTTIDDAAM